MRWCCFKSLYRVIRLFIHQYPMMGTQPSNVQTGDLIQPLHCLFPPIHQSERMSIELILFTLTTGTHTRINTCIPTPPITAHSTAHMQLLFRILALTLMNTGDIAAQTHTVHRGSDYIAG